MEKHSSIPLIGYASGIAAGDTGCKDGPIVLQSSSLVKELAAAGHSVHWHDMLYPNAGNSKVAIVADIGARLAQQTQTFVTQQQFFSVLAGDHACAIGTWSGAATALKPQGSLGLIWIDAHMDAHTFATTESGNIHGMPVASLLGCGAAELTNIASPHPKLSPEYICLIGVRSYETGEAMLLQRLGVRIYAMAEVQQRGIEVVLQEALEYVKRGTSGFGISLDLDAIDPKDAPGVGTPTPNGIAADELCRALKIISVDPKLLGVEIVEFNPHHDINHQTERLIQQLLCAVLPTRT